MPPLFGISSSMLLQRPMSAAIELARRHDLPAFEVWADHPHAHPDETSPDARAALRRDLAGFKRVSVHGPLGNASLASINPGIWRESVRQYLGAVELAHDIGAAVLVVHPGDLRDARFSRRSRKALARRRSSSVSTSVMPRSTGMRPTSSSSSAATSSTCTSMTTTGCGTNTSQWDVERSISRRSPKCSRRSTGWRSRRWSGPTEMRPKRRTRC